MAIPTLPIPPSRADSANFIARGDAFLGALPAWGDAANATAVEVSAKQVQATAAATAAQGASAVAQAASDAAQAVANFKGQWSTLSGAVSIPASVYHAGNFWVLLASQANVAAVEPGVSGVWQTVNGWRTPLPTLRPTLLLDFAAAQVVDPRISFARTSSATRVNARGLIEQVPAGVPRITYDPVSGACKGLLMGQAATNLFTYTDIHAVGWGLGVNMGRVGVVAAPDGSLSAGVYTSTVGGNAFVNQSIAVAAATTYTMSVYARLVSGSVPTAGALMVVDYDTDGTAGTAERMSLGWTGLTTTWKRFSLTFSNVAANTSSKFICTDFANGAKIAVWGAQLEVGVSPSSLVPSTDTFVSRTSVATFVGSNGLIQSAATNVARMAYNPLDLSVAPKLLLEPAATNFLSWSEEFDQATWLKAAATVTANAATSPGGSATADKLQETSASSVHATYQSRTGANETVTLSVFVKAAERSQVSLSMSNGVSASLRAIFDLANASVLYVDPVNADYTAPMTDIVNYGGGWFRCVLTVTKGAINTNNNAEISVCNGGLASYTGTAGSGVYIWGAQLQAGMMADSYIFTAGGTFTRTTDVASSAQATRSADNAQLGAPNVTSWLNPAEGTMVISHSAETYSASIQDSCGLLIDDGSTFNRLALRYYTGNNTASFDAMAAANAASQTDTAEGAYPVGTLVTHALAYRAGDSAYCRNGEVPGVDPTFVVPLGLGVARIGSSQSGSSLGEQCIARIAYYPERLPNATLQSLTAQ